MSRTPLWRKALPEPSQGKGNFRIYAKWNEGDTVIEAVFDVKEISSGSVAELVRRARNFQPKVHVLVAGNPFCDLGYPPKDWPEGHTWVSVQEASKATCEQCIEGSKKWLELQIR